MSEAPAAAADPPEGQVQEVLVVDDNPATRYATSRVLRAAGFRTREASTGEQALDLADNTLAAVILDVHLPDMDGFEVCRQMRGRDATARLPVIHLSATYVNDRDKVRGLDSGADAYVTHPADPTLLVATVRALVRARVAEEALRRSELRFRAIYDEAPSGICLIDAEGRFIDANNAMLSLLRRERQDVLGRRVVEFAPPELAEPMARYLGRSTKGLSRASFPLLDAAARAVDLEWSLSTHVEPGLSIATVTDVSEMAGLARQREELLEREQAARAAAERASRAKDELIAVLSHELRTPLNAILGWVHVLKRREQVGPMARALEGIERGARAQARLVSDILDVSRLDLGKLRLNIETVDAAELVRSALADCRDAIDDKAITVSIAGGASRPLRADPERLRQVLWNLLSNATKFSEQGGRIWIDLLSGEDGLSLRVRDEGQGIDPQFLPHVFERFTQSDSGSNRFHGGLGLGMSIVAHLVELHGGTVAAHSEGVGRGATFTVTLPWSPLNGGHDAEPSPASPPPRASQPESQDGGEDPASSSLAGLTVLAVEDDQEAREMLSMILRERGARVLSAGSCDGALRMLQRERPDVLISDVGMPGQDGYDLVRRIRAQEQEGGGSRLPAIALTAFAREKDRQLALASGFDAHCAKPLRPHELIELVLRVTSARAAPTGSA